jgi:TonB family protein
MLTFVLPDSRPSLAMMVQSTFLHVALITGALWATRSVADVSIIGDRWNDVVLTWQPATTVTTGATGLGQFVAPPVITDIPTELPPIDPVLVGPHPVDPRTLIAVLPTAFGTDTNPPIGSAATIFQESEVDDVPVLRTAPALRYPRLMAEAGIEGSVTFSFVIDTTGRVAAGSAKVIRTSHEAFVAAAEEAVYGSLFIPAKRRGEAVPVLVRQTVSFRK